MELEKHGKVKTDPVNMHEKKKNPRGEGTTQKLKKTKRSAWSTKSSQQA